MYGYKIYFNGLVDKYGNKYELNKQYSLNGDVSWNKRGYHFCTNIEDCLRYFDKFDDDIVFTKVIASGLIRPGNTFENEYYGYYDMFTASEIKIVEILSREDFINMVKESNNEFRIIRLIQSLKLTEEEIKLLECDNENILKAIQYYQYDNKNIYKKTLKK